MSHILRFLRIFALGTWVGSIIYFSAVVTQGAFAVLSRDQAGALVGYTLGGLHWMGVIAAVVFLIASVALGKSLTALVRPAAIGVILMLLVTLASQRVVIPRMDVLRAQMGSVDATPAVDPRRGEFDRLHGVSVDLEVAVLLIGLASLFLVVRDDRRVEAKTKAPG
jgi:hypothetical protein